MNDTIKIIKDSKLLSKGAFSVLLYITSVGGIWTKGQRALLQEMSGTTNEEDWLIQPRQLVDVLNELEKWKYIKKEINPQRRNAKIYKVGGTDA